LCRAVSEAIGMIVGRVLQCHTIFKWLPIKGKLTSGKVCNRVYVPRVWTTCIACGGSGSVVWSQPSLFIVKPPSDIVVWTQLVQQSMGPKLCTWIGCWRNLYPTDGIRSKFDLQNLRNWEILNLPMIALKAHVGTRPHCTCLLILTLTQNSILCMHWAAYWNQEPWWAMLLPPLTLGNFKHCTCLPTAFPTQLREKIIV
jgi:hypothetical protein